MRLDPHSALVERDWTPGGREYDGTLNEKKVLAAMKRRNPRWQFLFSVDEERDLQSAARLALLQNAECSTNGTTSAQYTPTLFRACAKAVYACARDLGYNKASKSRSSRFPPDDGGNQFEPHDVCICGYDSVMPELCKCGLDKDEYTIVDRIRKLYKMHTAEEVCNILGIKHTIKIARALSYWGGEHSTNSVPGGKYDKRGGKRPNAGRKNKSGIKSDQIYQCRQCRFKQNRRVVSNPESIKCPKCGNRTLNPPKR
jgi:hypothetical protein